ncbi:MAG: hypothetical protein COT84_07935 [Chlamydiae bacterium CG10_big_fil_rev_8_21_14_0_10_35_9]|nr:MAG: hypothetical protein COT84_07935 [Chlamydiae bacterium CG10_big_fil_rev_8_21_14_0_10_35_9]
MTSPVSSRSLTTTNHSSDLEIEAAETTQRKISQLKIDLSAQKIVRTWNHLNKRINSSHPPDWQHDAWSKWLYSPYSTPSADLDDATPGSEFSNSSNSSDDLSPAELGIFNNVRFCLELTLK